MREFINGVKFIVFAVIMILSAFIIAPFYWAYDYIKFLGSGDLSYDDYKNRKNQEFIEEMENIHNDLIENLKELMTMIPSGKELSRLKEED